MALTKPLMPVWIFMLEAFGAYRDLNSSTFGCVTPMQTLMQYAERVMEIEQGTFTHLVFTTTGGLADECHKYHSRLAELMANKKGESCSSVISWIKAKVSFAILRSAILCLRGSRFQKTTATLC